MWTVIKDLLTTRGAQLVARYSGVGLTMLATKLGITFEASQLSSMSSGLTTLVIAGLLFLADHYIHKTNTPTA